MQLSLEKYTVSRETLILVLEVLTEHTYTTYETVVDADYTEVEDTNNPDVIDAQKRLLSELQSQQEK